MKKILAFVLMMCLLLCAASAAYAVALPSKIWFVYDELTVQVGDMFDLGLVTYPENSGDHFQYTFSKKNVVELTEYYEFRAVGAGTTTVTCKGKLSGLKASFKVTVVDPNKVNKVVLDASGTVTLNMGETLQLNAAVEPATAQTTLKWSTSSKKIAVVDENGVVIPMKEGTATITVKTPNGKKDSVKVKVVDPYKPTKVVLAESGTVTLNIDKTLQLNAALAPETAQSKLTWSTSSKKIATVDGNGVVMPMKEGIATITVKTANGKKDTVKVKVVDPYKPTKVVLDASGTVTLNMGETLQLNAALAPETAQSKLTWSTSSKKIAVVDENGVVTPVKEGTATITVKTANGKKDTVKVKVVDPYKPIKVTLDRTGSFGMEKGETVQLTATLYPETAKTTLTWKSSDPKVASVDGNGLVTCHKSGSVSISVATANGKKATVKVKGIGEAMPKPGVGNDLLGFLGRPISELEDFVGELTVSKHSKWVWGLNGQLDCYLSEGNQYDTMPKGYVERIVLNPPGSNHTAAYKGEYTLGGIDENRYAIYADAAKRLLNDGWELKAEGDSTSSWLYSRFGKTVYDRESGKKVNLSITLVHEWGARGHLVEVSASASMK